MKRILLVAVLLLALVSVANAASVTLSWNLPTENCDLSALTDYDRTVIRWGTTSGGPYPNTHVVSSPTETTATLDVGQQDGTTLYFVAAGVDASGNYSDGPGGCGTSGEVAVPFGQILPSPPTNLTGAQAP